MGDESPPRPRGILLIEDEEEHAAIIVRSFERDSAFVLTVASTVAEGVAALESGEFDLVIADWRLPDGEAFDLLTDKRRVPLLIMTSHGDEKVAVRAMKAGALDYVVKSQSSLLDMPHIAERALQQWMNLVAQKLADEQLRRALNEKTVLLQEVHHRVKNNLQIVCALLWMQVEDSEKRSLETASLKEAYARVMAMSLVHEQMYGSKSLGDLDFSEYITDFSERLFEAYCVDPARIRIELSVEPVHLNLDSAVPFGLILNELVSNCLKHAFGNGRTGLIRVSLEETAPGQIELAVADNGVGLPVGFRLEESKSLGLEVVRTLSRQLGADLIINGDAAAADEGTTFRVRWNVPDHARSRPG